MTRRLLFTVLLAVFAFGLQFAAPDRLASVDGYFHVRYCALMREAGLTGFPLPFPWLPLTILAPQHYFDHHWLYHVLLAPFFRGDLVLRGKLIAAAGAALAFLACYWFLCWQRARAPEWWTIAILASTPGFLYRMEMPRVQSWSLLCLLGALALLMRERHGWLLPLAWFYTWLYDAFPLLLGLCACATAAAALVERRFEPRPVAFASAGVVVGLVVNPYFPNDLRFIAHHYLGKLRGDSVPVGTEWYPLPVAEWFGNAGLIAVAAAVLAITWRQRAELGTGRVTLVLCGLFFFALLWRSARFVEYCVPFAGLALATSCHGAVQDRLTAWTPRRRRAAALLLLAWWAVSAGIAAAKIRGRPAPATYSGAATWLAAHAPAGSLVFNAEWDAFPLLFFHNTANRYVVGLDPTYLSRSDRSLYDAWAAVAGGREKRPAAVILQRFGARFAVVGRRQQQAIERMDADPAARRVYEDADAIVYGLRPGHPS